MHNAKALPVFLLLFLMSLMTASLASAGELSPGLKAMLDDTAADDAVSVIVHFNNRVDIGDLSAQLTAQKATRQQRHAEIIYALQDASRIQDDLAVELDAATARGGVLGYTSYWIANVMVVQATPYEVEQIALREDVDYVEPNFVPELIEPRDVHALPAKSEMDTRGIGTTPGVDAVRAPECWEILGIDGSGAIIGSLDTGVDGNHPAFNSRWRGNFADADECWLDVLGNNTTFPVDNHGHGTHTVGTMAGVAVDDTIGVAPGAQWIAANAIDQGASTGFDNDIIACFQWFADPDGNPETIADVPDVVQNSWGVNENFDGYYDCDDRWWDVIDNCEAAGVVVVWSAGNEGPGPGTLRSPADRVASIYNSFSVGSTLNYAPYTISSFSSRGPSTCAFVDPAVGIKPEVSAPGSDIYSAQPGGGYVSMSGTSMAGPHVSGVVALMRSANPNLEVNDVKQILMDTAVDLGASGEDNDYGWGIIDAYAAVEACLTGYGTLSGQVTNALLSDSPLAGASVTIPERGTTTTTDANGYFSTRVPEGAYTLIVNMVGFESAEQANVLVYEDTETVQNFSLLDNAGPVLSDRSGDLATSDQMGPYTLGVQAFDTSGVDGVVLHWLAQGSIFNSVAMTLVRGGYTADVPGQMANTDIRYYFTATDEFGQATRYPEVSSEYFSLLITNVHYFTDVEDPGDSQWIMGAPGDDATTGLWERGDPTGTDYNGLVMQAEDDHTAAPGVACYLTGNSIPGDTAGSNDVDDGCTTLTTPVFELAAFDRAVVKYWCWYSEGGLSNDDDFVVEVSNDNGNSWVELDRIVDIANSWNEVSVELNTLDDGMFTLSDQIVIRFLACDLNTGSLVEVAIDDFSIETFIAEDVSAVDDVPVAQKAVMLHQNHPNPFNPTTTIAFALPRGMETKLVVYAIDGTLVTTLLDEMMPAGEHQVTWDGRDSSGGQVASGAYFYRLNAGNELKVKRMVLVK